MLFNTDGSLDQKLQQQDRKIQEAEMRIANLDEEVEDLLESLKVSPKQLTAFLENRENFSEANWLEVSKQKKQFDEKLKRDLDHVRNPIKSKRAYSSLHVQRHWLHVK